MLQREPIFTRALTLASEMLHRGPKELFAPAAGASAEVACWQQLTRDDRSVDDIVYSEPVFLRLSPAQWREEG